MPTIFSVRRSLTALLPSPLTRFTSIGLAAISLNRYEISATAVDIIACTQKLLHGFKHQSRLASISLKLDIGASLNALGSRQILLDPVRMSQIINNLLSNAIRFTAGRPNSRVITLSVNVSTSAATTPPRLENFLASSPVFVLLAVSDTGVGMSEEEKTKLFQYCSQASPLTHLRFGGSGLGLWIVKRTSSQLHSAESEMRSETDIDLLQNWSSSWAARSV